MVNNWIIRLIVAYESYVNNTKHATLLAFHRSKLDVDNVGESDSLLADVNKDRSFYGISDRICEI